LDALSITYSLATEDLSMSPSGGSKSKRTDARAVRAASTEIIHAPLERVRSLYLDYTHWPQLFPETIKGVRLIRDDGATKMLEIHHAEGKVLNVLSQPSPREIRLKEWKRHYDACFTNIFEAVPEGTRYSVLAEVKAKGALRLLAPFGRALIRSLLMRYVLEPLRRAAESGAVFASTSALPR
jgi:hypothetical protein